MHEYLPVRKNMRLSGYDYSLPGYYFVTIVVDNREHLFGEVENNDIISNDNAILVRACWNDLSNHYPVKTHEFIVMPNHIHGIIQILNQDVGGRSSTSPVRTIPNTHKNHGYDERTNHDKREGRRPSPTTRYTLSTIIGSFKSYSSNRINLINETVGSKIWQRGYYDHIIRGREDMNRVCEYIQNNPINWTEDEFHNKT